METTMLYSRRYPKEPAAAAPEPPPTTPDLTSALIRLAELRELYDAQGWKAIKALGDKLGVEKHPDGWEHSLMGIIEAEYSADIASALEEAIDPLQGEAD
jgi:hypothetical protein